MADPRKAAQIVEMAIKRAAQAVLSQAEREANKAKFLEQSADPRRFYHGSKNPDITDFKTRKDMTDQSGMTGHYADERDAVFLSPDPEFTSHFSVQGYTDVGQAPTTYPVYAQIKNPFDFDNPEHLQRVKDTYLDMYHNPESELYDPNLLPSERSIKQLRFNKGVDSLPEDVNNWPRIENQEFQDVLKDIGYDSFYTRERGTKNIGVYDPNVIKSATGNRGTYDVSDSDINKAHGGSVHMAEGGAVHMEHGGITPRLEKYYQTSGDERNVAAGLPADFYRKGLTDVASHGYSAGVGVPVGDAKLTADLMGYQYVSPQIIKDMLAAARLGIEFPVGEGRIRGEITRPFQQGAPMNYGIRYSRPFAEGGQVRHFDEGGDVSAEREQAELDRMIFELGRAQNPNSPVIEATPQSTTQKLFGTVGGYMDRAGKFINESLEPIAQSNPVKTFLADMLLASPLKGAGTALQDYTKTSRDITEDQPYGRSPFTGSGETLHLDPRVLDIAQFASPVVRGATKLAGAGAKALTPFAKNTAEMAAELYGSGKMPFTVAPNAYMAEPSAPKPSRVLAPANEQGFYSPVEAAALNLQRKTGNGQAFLNDIMKQENVRPDEINAMGLDTFLKDKKNVTAAEVQDYIAQNKLQLGESTYIDPESIYAKSEALNTKIAEVASKYGLRKQQFGSGFVNDKDEFVRDIPDDLRELQRQYVENRNLHPKTAKFGEHALPGGDNYREVVLTLPSNRPSLKNMSRSEYNAAVDAADKAGVSDYQSTHWDEPNPLAHLRMSDRVTDGKKTLLVDEVQSDWHQAGREQGYQTEKSTIAKKAYQDYASDLENRYVDAIRAELAPNYIDPIALNDQVKQVTMGTGIGQMAKYLGEKDKFTDLYKNFTLETNQNQKGVPDAPFKDDWYQLALKRAVKEAIDGGYDRVALITGNRVNDRFDLSKKIDRIDYNKNPDGTYRMSASQGGEEVFVQEWIKEKELPNILGKELANKLIKNEGELPSKDILKSLEEEEMPVYKTLSGLDLKVGGEGNRKYYDEIYPNYLKKLGKKYGATVGETTVKHQQFGAPEPLHYMDITPAMRKEFSTGIHMKDGGSVNLAEGGIVAGSQGLKYADDGDVSMEAGGYVPMRRGGKVELTNDLAKMRNELQIKKGRK